MEITEIHPKIRGKLTQVGTKMAPSPTKVGPQRLFFGDALSYKCACAFQMVQN